MLAIVSKARNGVQYAARASTERAVLDSTVSEGHSEQQRNAPIPRLSL